MFNLEQHGTYNIASLVRHLRPSKMHSTLYFLMLYSYRLSKMINPSSNKITHHYYNIHPPQTEERRGEERRGGTQKYFMFSFILSSSIVRPDLADHLIRS